MGRQERQELVGPFHHRHAVTVKELLQPQVEELREALGPVGVQVIDGQPPPVLVNQDKGGARGRLGDAEPPHQPLEETGLSGAALPDGGHPLARLRKAPTIPVSTSPDPPLANPGFPVVLGKTLPAWSPMTVRAPFSATKA